MTSFPSPAQTPFDQRMAQLIDGPEFPDRWFVHGETTFGGLYAMAADIRRHLAGAMPAGGTVCLCAEDRAIVTAALLATLGSPHVLAIPHAYSAQALEELHALTAAPMAITDIARELPPAVASFTPSTDARPSRGAPVTVDPDRAWLRLFTGGSTGIPRIWSKTPGNLLKEVFYLHRAYRIGADDRIVATVPPNHIYGLLYAILLPLAASATVMAETPTFPQEIISAVDRHRATVLISVPVHYRILNGQPPFGKNLRIAFSSAGALDPGDGLAFFRQTGTPVTEIYGSTETGGIAGRRREAGEVSFHPFDAITWSVTGDRLRIRSDFLSPELATDADGYFATADRVAAADDGFLLRGRSDGIVKVGGKRVDMEKVRETLMGLSGVHDAFVMAMALGNGRENELVAVVAGDTDRDRIRSGLRGSLEPHETPRRVRVVKRLPMTASGKYDRNALTGLIGDESS